MLNQLKAIKGFEIHSEEQVIELLKEQIKLCDKNYQESSWNGEDIEIHLTELVEVK